MERTRIYHLYRQLFYLILYYISEVHGAIVGSPNNKAFLQGTPSQGFSHTWSLLPNTKKWLILHYGLYFVRKILEMTC